MERVFEIPQGVTAKLEKHVLTVKGPKGELTRRFAHPRVVMSIEGNAVRILAKPRAKGTVPRKVGALAGTWEAHARNMARGVSSGWEAKVKVVFSHFPIKVTAEGESVLIANFLGERAPRRSRIMPGTKVSVQKDEIVVTGIDKEAVGQTAANIETAAKITKYDRRVFQDGCYITQLPKALDAGSGLRRAAPAAPARK